MEEIKAKCIKTTLLFIVGLCVLIFFAKSQGDSIKQAQIELKEQEKIEQILKEQNVENVEDLLSNVENPSSLQLIIDELTTNSQDAVNKLNNYLFQGTEEEKNKSMEALVEFHQKNNDFNSAIKTLNTFLANSSDIQKNNEAYKKLAQIYKAQGDYYTALKNLENVYNNTKEISDFHNLANMVYKIDDVNYMQEIINKRLAEYPQDRSVLGEYEAWIQMKNNPVN